MKSISLTAAILAAVLACPLFFTGSARGADREVLLEIEIRGIQALTNAIAQMAAALDAQAQAPMATEALQGKISPMGMAGLDKTGTLRVMFFVPDQDPMQSLPDYVIMLPAQDDGSTLIKQFGQPLAPLDDAVGEYASPGATGQVASSIFAATVKRYVVLSENRDLVDMIRTRIRSGALVPADKIPVRGTVALNPNMAAIARLFSEKMNDNADAMKDLPQAQTGGMNSAAILKAEADALQDILVQFRSCSLGFAGNRKNFSIYTRAEGKQDTWMARSFAAARKPDPIYYKLLPEKCFWTQAGHWSEFDNFMDGYNAFLSRMYRSMGPQWSGVEQIVSDATKKLKGVFPGDYAYGMLVGSDGAPFGAVMYAAVTDPARMQKVIDESIDAFQEKQSDQETEGMKVSIKRGARRAYKETPIQAYRHSFVMPPQANMMTPGMSAWTNMTYEIAYLDKMYVVSMGSSAEMDRALDRIKNPGETLYDQPAFKQLFPKLSGDPVRVSTFSVLGYIRMLMTMMMGAAPPMPQASGNGLCSYTIVRDGVHYSATRISFDELKTVKMMAPMLMMGTGAMQPPGAPAPPAGPAP